jgi:hypothetical protein
VLNEVVNKEMIVFRLAVSGLLNARVLVDVCIYRGPRSASLLNVLADKGITTSASFTTTGGIYASN